MFLEGKGCIRQLDGERGIGHDLLSDGLCCRQQGQATLHGSPQHGPRDEETVDLIGPFPDAVDSAIPVGSLGRILGAVPIAPQGLNILINTVVRRF